MSDKHDDKAKRNLKALREFRLKGEPIKVGQVIPKADFAKKGDWQNLCNMTPAKLEETDEQVGKPKAAKVAKADATAGGIPAAS